MENQHRRIAGYRELNEQEMGLNCKPASCAIAQPINF
jgi:hypothetical protein